jgi:hypothetical protein
VPNSRRLRILSRLPETGASAADQLCHVCMDVTAMSGVGIMLMSSDAPSGSPFATNAVSALIEELQITLGEGPCVDAYKFARPVVEPDLAAASGRWTAFTPAVLAAGVRAIFGFPLWAGSNVMGALDLYRDRPGALSEDQHADALVMADIVGEAILLSQSLAPPGELATALEPMGKLQDIVHGATGMVSAQLGVSVGEALARLRAYSFAVDRPLVDVAREVVARRLRIDSATGERDAAP